MRSRTIVILAALLLTLGIPLGAGYAWYCRYWKVYHGYAPLPFSKQAWAAADAETRGHMAVDLLAKHELKGMTSRQVVELLGPADKVLTEEGTGLPGLYEYSVGYMGFNPRGIMVFSYELRIVFDRQGVVDQAYIDD